MNNDFEEENTDNHITKLVKEKIDSELNLIKVASGVIFKVFGVSIALLLGFFTLLGVSTWKDIKRETLEYIKQETDNIIENDNLNGGVKKTLNNLVNLSILNSSLIKINYLKIALIKDKNKDEKILHGRVSPTKLSEKEIKYLIKINEKFKLKDNEWSRLREWTKEESLGLQEFKDVLSVLNKQSDFRKK